MLPENISDFTLEQYRLDELPAGEKERIERLAASDGRLRARLEKLDNENQAFAGSDRAQAVLDRLKPRTGGAIKKLRMHWSQTVPLAVAAAALIVLVPFAVQQTNSDTRIKGGSSHPDLRLPQVGDQGLGISIFILQGNSSSALASGAMVHRGDRVQVALNVAKNHYALLLSIDGTGHLTLHAPDSLKSPLAGGDAPQLLPFAYQLDNAPYFERFVLVTSAREFEPEKVWNAIQTQTTAWLAGHPGEPPVLKLDGGLNLNIFDLQKPHKGNS